MRDRDVRQDCEGTMVRKASKKSAAPATPRPTLTVVEVRSGAAWRPLGYVPISARVFDWHVERPKTKSIELANPKPQRWRFKSIARYREALERHRERLLLRTREIYDAVFMISYGLNEENESAHRAMHRAWDSGRNVGIRVRFDDGVLWTFRANVQERRVVSGGAHWTVVVNSAIVES